MVGVARVDGVAGNNAGSFPVWLVRLHSWLVARGGRLEVGVDCRFPLCGEFLLGRLTTEAAAEMVVKL